MANPDIIVNVQDGAVAIPQAAFNIILIFDPTTDAAYEEVTQASEITGWTSGDLAYEIVDRAFQQDIKPEKIALYGVDVATAASTITDELNTLITTENDWYLGGIASRVDADQKEFIEFCNSNNKFPVTQTDIAKTATEIDTFMGTVAGLKKCVLSHDGGTAGTDPYFDGAVLGYLATHRPGTYTLKFKVFAGIPTPTYSTTDISTILDSGSNTYNRAGYLAEGTSDVGEAGIKFVDTEIWKAFLDARITENLLNLYRSQDKTALDDNGIGQNKTAIEEVLQNEFNTGTLIDDEDQEPFLVSAPRRQDISSNDRANRKLPNVRFEAYYSSAIHSTEVTGEVLV